MDYFISSIFVEAKSRGKFTFTVNNRKWSEFVQFAVYFFPVHLNRDGQKYIPGKINREKKKYRYRPNGVSECGKEEISEKNTAFDQMSVSVNATAIFSQKKMYHNFGQSP